MGNTRLGLGKPLGRSARNLKTKRCFPRIGECNAHTFCNTILLQTLLNVFHLECFLPRAKSPFARDHANFGKWCEFEPLRSIDRNMINKIKEVEPAVVILLHATWPDTDGKLCLRDLNIQHIWIIKLWFLLGIMSTNIMTTKSVVYLPLV